MSVEPLVPAAPGASGPAAGGEARGGLWAAERRQLIVGLVLTITLVAFEALAIATVMPGVKDDLGGLRLYGWVFSAFFLTSLLGIELAGQMADRHGLALPYLVGLVLFGAGLVIGGAAQSMPMLIVGRALQGFGAGAIPAVGYAAIARGIPSELRPRMFAVLSTAWVLPGVAGPGAALGIEHLASWRAVFLALVPIAVVAGIMTAPALAALDRTDQADGPAAAAPARTADEQVRVRNVLLLVVGIGAVSGAAAGAPLAASIVLVAIGVPLAARSIIRLLPAGTARLAPGVPATIAARGILTFAFFAADAFVTLSIVDGRGGASWIGGVALTASCLAWAGASWLSAHLIDRLGPRRIDQLGFAVLAVAIVLLIAAAQGGPLAGAVLAWGVGGAAIGFAYSPQAVTVLASAPAGGEGAASAAIQLCDGLGITLGTSAGGAIIAFGDAQGWTVADAVSVVFAMALVAALGGIAAAGRLPERVPAQAA